MAQVQQNAVCNAAHKVEGRISRCPLELYDRSGDDKIPLKQDTLAQMLAIRRTTVSLAAGNLEKDGVLICGRGCMQIVSRDELQRRSCECYGRVKGTLRNCTPLSGRMSRDWNFRSLRKQCLSKLVDLSRSSRKRPHWTVSAGNNRCPKARPGSAAPFAPWRRERIFLQNCGIHAALSSLRHASTRVLVLTQKAVLYLCVDSVQPLFRALALLLISRGLRL
jgi:hypothetical protein